MIAGLKPVPVIFWSTENGYEPVREWLKGLPKDDRKKIGEDLEDASTWLANGHALVQIA